MIRTFRDNETKRIFCREYSKKLPTDIQESAFRKLRMINRSISINDLRIPPANRLEKMKGSREGQYSIRVNDQWRICFEWYGTDAFKVEIVDYHRG
jgi:proteic killer suppression protein